MQFKNLASATILALASASCFAETDHAMVEVSVSSDNATTQSANYPKMALRKRVEGEVIVEFTINADGKAEDIAIVDAQPRGFFDRSTIQAVKNTRYSPSDDADKVASGLSDGKIQQKFIYSLDPSITKGKDSEG